MLLSLWGVDMTVRLHFLQETRSPQNGKLDAERVAQTFGLSMKELARIVGRDQGGLKKHPTSDTLQLALRELDEVGVQLRDVFGSLEVGRMWLRAPNPLLDGQMPLTYLFEHQPVAVQRLLRMAETGMPT